MLNLTDHLRRLRVDKYEYVAMKVIVLLQSGAFQFSMFPSWYQLFPHFHEFLFVRINRHIWVERTRKSAWMSRKSITSITIIHISILWRCSIEIRWTASTNTRTSTNLSGKLQFYSLFYWFQSNFIRFIPSFTQVGKEMLTIKSKDGAEFNLLLELLRGEHWQH